MPAGGDELSHSVLLPGDGLWQGWGFLTSISLWKIPWQRTCPASSPSFWFPGYMDAVKEELPPYPRVLGLQVVLVPVTTSVLTLDLLLAQDLLPQRVF